MNDAIRGDDIFQCGDVIDSPRLALHLVLRLVHPACFHYVAKHLALFGNGDGALLRDIVFFNSDDVLRSIHHKGNRFSVEHIPPWTLLFVKFKIPKRKRLWQHEGTCGIRHEGVDVDRAGIV